MDWTLECSDCGTTAAPDGLPTVCTACGRPWLVRYPTRQHPVTERAEARHRHGMWRYRSFLPLAPGEEPVTLGEGDTPLLRAPRLAATLDLGDIWIKDEGCNPTGSFKSRGLSAAITRAVHGGAKHFTVPTAGNAGVASAAYAARARATVRVFAPRTTPKTILAQIVSFGGDLVLLDGHIGDCGKASRAFAAETGAMDLSTLREPYRIEGKKTLGLEIAMQFNWTLPDVIIYPTGGGTGLIGMWKAFLELRQAGWVTDELPRMYTVQSTGCAPIVKAFAEGAVQAEPWPHPWTIASAVSGSPGRSVTSSYPDPAGKNWWRDRGYRRDDERARPAWHRKRRDRLLPGRWRGAGCHGGIAAPGCDQARGPGRRVQHRRRLALPGRLAVLGGHLLAGPSLGIFGAGNITELLGSNPRHGRSVGISGAGIRPPRTELPGVMNADPDDRGAGQHRGHGSPPRCAISAQSDGHPDNGCRWQVGHRPVRNQGWQFPDKHRGRLAQDGFRGRLQQRQGRQEHGRHEEVHGSSWTCAQRID